MNKQSTEQPGVRRSLFWRLWFRSLTVKRPQAALAVSSVLVGAAVASMLLNLYGDVRRKMTQEFRAYGPNVFLAPGNDSKTGSSSAFTPNRAASPEAVSGVMDERVMDHLAGMPQSENGFAAVPLLYAVEHIQVAAAPSDHIIIRAEEEANVVALGTDFNALRRLNPSWRVDGDTKESAESSSVIGAHIASRLKLRPGDSIQLGAISDGQNQSEHAKFLISGILSTGASEDDQVFVPLASLQQLGGLQGKISLVELSVPGETAEVERVMGELSKALSGFPGIEVRPVRQIVYSSGRVLDTIRWVMFSLTGLILIIISLCVMATMTAIVLERRKDIAVMKSLGASDRLLIELFLSEGATLGLIGGLVGFGLGLFLAHEMARQLFNVSLSLTWWTFPLVCLASMMLAVGATLFPVEIVRGIQPARVLRGD
jgi:putative ABC transport system permease protein